MHTPSADSARQLTQAVLLAWLCHRYHDLATYASESLKQRIHFLAKPDASNLQDLFIWDPPSSSTPTSTSSTALTSWSSAQIQEFIQRHWSADQLPLNPPHPHSSWDAVPVYCRELDPETRHAIVPLGQQDHATVAVVLAVVKDHHASNKGDKAPCWKYHNIVVMHESELQSSQGWYPSSEWMALQKRASVASNDSSEAAPVKLERGHGPDPVGDEDSDDDYWGQYNDSEDDDGDSSAAAAAAAGDTVHTTTGATVDDDEDDDDEYWRKYAEQQEQHDRDERKKKMQESSAQMPFESTTTFITTDHEDRSPLASSIHSSTTIQESATLNSLGASASSLPSTRPGQLDPTMLSSLMQMLVAQGMNQSSSSSSSSSTPLSSTTTTTTTTTTTQPSSAPTVAHPDPDQRSKSRIVESMRSIVQDCHRAGFSKEEVFEMLQSAYSTSHLLAK
ncbi:unnamed protein product [Mortierella alpina]